MKAPYKGVGTTPGGIVAHILEQLPDDANVPHTLNNAGVQAIRARNYNAAMKILGAAVQLEPTSPIIIDNLAACVKHGGDSAGAIALYLEALRLDPGYATAEQNMALTLLAQGKLQNGWKHYRARFKARAEMQPIYDPISGKPMQDVPVPTKAQMRGKRILIVNEQGLGDQLLFARFIPRLIEHIWPHRVSWAPEARLIPLLDHKPPCELLLPEEVERRAKAGEFDVSLALGDIPLALNHAESHGIPPPVQVEPPLGIADSIRAVLKRHPRPWIGLQWRAGVRGLLHAGGLYKAIGFDELFAWAKDLPGTLISLQRQPHEHEMTPFLAREHSLNLAAFSEDIERAAAVLGLLDYYITVPNTNVHIAAGLWGHAETHVLTPYPSEWRWSVPVGAYRPNYQSRWFPYKGIVGHGQSEDGTWTKALEAIRPALTHGRIVPKAV